MNETGKMIAGLILAGAMAVLSACNNGGGGAAPASTNAYGMPTTNGALNTVGGQGNIQPGVYAGVVSMDLKTNMMDSPTYAYFMRMLNMQIPSINFQVTVHANGQVPGSARFMIQPMRQVGSYYDDYNQPYAGQQQGDVGMYQIGETTAYTGNGMLVTYLGNGSTNQCPQGAGMNCSASIPDLQIVATVSSTPTNSPRSACGGGYGFRPSMNVQIRVKNVVMANGVLCGSNGYGQQQMVNRGYPGYPYQRRMY